MIFKRVLLITSILIGAIGFSQDVDHPLAIPDSCLFVSNVVTPDFECLDCSYFNPVILCSIEDYKLVIYDRYGEIIFESSRIEDRWYVADVDDGVYVWQITGTMRDSATPFAFEKKGHVCVLK